MISSAEKVHKKILLFLAMQVTKKIFTRVATKFFFNRFAGDILFTSLVSFAFFVLPFSFLSDSLSVAQIISISNILSLSHIFPLSNKTFTFWKSSFTVLGPFSKLEVDESISEGNESLFSKRLLFCNWTLHGWTLMYLKPCFISTLLALVQLQREALSNLNYLFVNNNLNHQYYKLGHYRSKLDTLRLALF